MPGLPTFRARASCHQPLKYQAHPPEYQVSPRKESAMSELRLAAIDSVRLSPAMGSRDGRRGHDGYATPRRKQSARERLVAVLAPGRSSETCEVDYAVDATGMMVAVLVRDALTGEVIARVEAEDLWQLGTDEAAGGLLLERRG